MNTIYEATFETQSRGERGDETRTVLNTGGTVNFYYSINERFVDVGFEDE